MSRRLLTAAETFFAVFEGCRSVARFGDGELSILYRKKSPEFQTYSDGLSKRLHSSLRGREHSVLLALPHARMRSPFTVAFSGALRKRPKGALPLPGERVLQFHPKQHLFYNIYGRRFVADYVRSGEDVGDAEAFWLQAHGDPNKEVPRLYRTFVNWVRDSPLVVVAPTNPLRGRPLYEIVRAISPEVEHIVCSANDSFEEVAELEQRIRRDACGRVLIQSGPTATILALSLGGRDRQVLDVGSFDTFLEGALTWVTQHAARH